MRLTLLSLLLFIVSSAYTASHVVQVSSNQFSPATLNVVVGDEVQFVYVDGFHTSTCDPNALPGTSFPAGASGWDRVMGSTSNNFSVTISVPGTYIYGCQPHWPSMQGTINATGPLPVKLVDFTVANVNNKAAISWKTTSELNIDYFSVRRSVDGTNFKEVTKIGAAGNSTTEKKYGYTDNLLDQKNKYFYYNLAIYGKDGKVEYSATKIFKNIIAKPKLIVSLSPNPISKPGHLMLKFNADKRGTLDAQLVNQLGKVVLQTQMQAFPGVNNGHFHLGDIAAGTYTVVFRMHGLKESHKLIVK